ncbi:hypothetical protein IW150_005679 [Coemansia sp. RSA 2607]|nr:hypothetical protein IW150_005679 [Coemansia sp. RSA 2607]KAJ2391070.1 hypothetical protein GGI05_003046 [Coemansia sp. RSA 2603]
MSFRFNFGLDADDEPNVSAGVFGDPSLDENMVIQTEPTAPVYAAPYESVPLAIPSVSSLMVDAIFYGNQHVWKRQIDDVQFQLAQQDSMDGSESSVMKQAMAEDKNASDVIKGVYEGGLKTWECSIDLLLYLVELQSKSRMALDGVRVLEIGCGTGLPSLHILKCVPSAHVCMQDYNRDVLELVTMPNVLANTVLSPTSGSDSGDVVHTEADTETCEIDIDFRRTQILFGDSTDEIIGKRDIPELSANEAHDADCRLLSSSDICGRCELIAGDWAEIEKELRRQSREHTFDLVLTSETIYDTDSYKKLHDLLECVLAKDGTHAQAQNRQKPMVLVAAKSIYFGLTGSVLTFRQYVESCGIFEAESVWQSGGSMPREILRLVWRNGVE